MVASSIADLRYGKRQRHVEINWEQTTCSLFQTYVSTIDGLGKYTPGVKSKLKGMEDNARSTECDADIDIPILKIPTS
jgi:hypothetical protein